MALVLNGSGITSANIADGTITNADINSSAAIDGSKLTGAGKVLQVVLSEATAGTSSTSTSFSDIGLSAIITPSSSNSKILCQWVVGYSMVTGSNKGFGTRLMRGAISAWESPSHYSVYRDNDIDTRSSATFMHLDSPATASAITYEIQTANHTTSLVGFNSQTASHLILMEIGA